MAEGGAKRHQHANAVRQSCDMGNKSIRILLGNRANILPKSSDFKKMIDGKLNWYYSPTNCVYRAILANCIKPT